MSAGSTLDPDAVPGPGRVGPPGHDTGSLGPSDVSDTGSDSVGPTGYDAAILAEGGDSVGTGTDPSPAQANDDDGGSDIGFDRVVRADEAGLGGGLDQAEEARYGVTDEALDPVDEAGAALDPAGAPRRRRREAQTDVEHVRGADEPDASPDDAMLADRDGTDDDSDADGDDDAR
jgi:hypothetical protein